MASSNAFCICPLPATRARTYMLQSNPSRAARVGAHTPVQEHFGLCLCLCLSPASLPLPIPPPTPASHRPNVPRLPLSRALEQSECTAASSPKRPAGLALPIISSLHTAGTASQKSGPHMARVASRLEAALIAARRRHFKRLVCLREACLCLSRISRAASFVRFVISAPDSSFQLAGLREP